MRLPAERIQVFTREAATRVSAAPTALRPTPVLAARRGRSTTTNVARADGSTSKPPTRGGDGDGTTITRRDPDRDHDQNLGQGEAVLRSTGALAHHAA